MAVRRAVWFARPATFMTMAFGAGTLVTRSAVTWPIGVRLAAFALPLRAWTVLTRSASFSGCAIRTLSTFWPRAVMARTFMSCAFVLWRV